MGEKKSVLFPPKFQYRGGKGNRDQEIFAFWRFRITLFRRYTTSIMNMLYSVIGLIQLKAT